MKKYDKPLLKIFDLSILDVMSLSGLKDDELVGNDLIFNGKDFLD